MARPRNKASRDWPQNLYKNAAGLFYYKNPTTGKTRSFGRDYQKARHLANSNNEILYGVNKVQDLSSWVSNPNDGFRAFTIIYLGTKLEWSDNTLRREKSLIEHMVKYFGDKSLSLISTKNVADFLQKHEKRPSMYASYKARLNNIFNTALQKGWLTTQNPVTPCASLTCKVKRSRIMLDDFQMMVQKAEQDMPPVVSLALKLAVVTGQRIGDLVKIRYRDIGQVLYVKQEKTKHELFLPLHLQAAGYRLDALLTESRKYPVVSQYVLHHLKAHGSGVRGGAVTENFLRGYFNQLLELAHVAVPEGRTKSTFHELRSLSRRLHAERYGPEVAKQVLGHKTDKSGDGYQDLRTNEFHPMISNEF